MRADNDSFEQWKGTTCAWVNPLSSNRGDPYKKIIILLLGFRAPVSPKMLPNIRGSYLVFKNCLRDAIAGLKGSPS